MRNGRRACLTVSALLVLVACTSGGHTAQSTPPKTSAPASTSVVPTPSTSAVPSPTASLPSGRPGAPKDVLTGLNVPWSIAVLPDRSALISLRDEAVILRVTAAGHKVSLGRVPGVTPGGEGGLLGLAISPTFSRDGLVFAYATTATGNRVLRMRLTGDKLSAPTPILTGIASAFNHNGGRLGFGPDGYLYVSTGDAGNRTSSQDRNSLNGKILRITPDGAPAPGNPFPGSRVWSMGHRNVQGFGWTSEGTMYASEFGQNRFDELNKITPGGNYGWPEVEGKGGDNRFIEPLVSWPTSEASPSGLAVTGDAVYLAALRGERLWRVPLTATGVGTPESLLNGTLGRLRDVVLAPGGGLWVLTSNTFRGKPKPGDDRLVRLPLN
jgi:glucose/arabinose dehydrogenase